MRAYQAYFSGGLCRERFGTESIRLLTVSAGAQRLHHLKVATEKTGARRRYWFATLDALRTGNPLTDPAWQVASAEWLYPLLLRP